MAEKKTLQVADQPEEPQPRGLISIRIYPDGNYQVQLSGVSQIETPSLLRLAAKRVEQELGI